jgi:hypothetical protein
MRPVVALNARRRGAALAGADYMELVNDDGEIDSSGEAFHVLNGGATDVYNGVGDSTAGKRAVVDASQLQAMFNAVLTTHCGPSLRRRENASTSTGATSSRALHEYYTPQYNASSDPPSASETEPVSALSASTSSKSSYTDGKLTDCDSSVVETPCNMDLNLPHAGSVEQPASEASVDSVADAEDIAPTLESEVSSGTEVNASMVREMACCIKPAAEDQNDDMAGVEDNSNPCSPRLTGGLPQAKKSDAGAQPLDGSSQPKETSSLAGAYGVEVVVQDVTLPRGQLRMEGDDDSEHSEDVEDDRDDILWALEQWEELQAQYAATEALRQSVATSAVLDGSAQKRVIGRGTRRGQGAEGGSWFVGQAAAVRPIDVTSLGNFFEVAPKSTTLNVDSKGAIRGRCTACKECRLYSPSGSCDEAPSPLLSRSAENLKRDVSPTPTCVIYITIRSFFSRLIKHKQIPRCIIYISGCLLSNL